MGHSLIYQPYISGNIPGYWVEGRFRSWETDKGQFGGFVSKPAWDGLACPHLRQPDNPTYPKSKTAR